MLHGPAEIMRMVCEDFEIDLIEFNGEEDYLHLLVHYPLRAAGSNPVNSLKVCPRAGRGRSSPAERTGRSSTAGSGPAPTWPEAAAVRRAGWSRTASGSRSGRSERGCRRRAI
ncbi:transposase [Streptomyces pseudovenezuelae]|uniref:transposase n=1 Tax=Streptomyces pseudovenezuelae TaxID=67350 RepID=UPI0032AFA054